MTYGPETLALGLVLVLVATIGLTALTQPRRAAGWIAGSVVCAAGVVILMSEIAGRQAYTPQSLTYAALIAAGLGLIAGAIGWRAFARPRPFRLAESMGVRTIVWAMLIVWAALMVWVYTAHVLSPPSVPDALRYHLVAVAQWHADGVIGQVTGADYRVNHFPHAMSLLWGWPLVLTRSDFYSGLFPVLTVFLLWPATVYLIASACGARRDAGIVLALCSAAVSPVFIQGMNEAVDVLFWATTLLTLYLAFAGREAFGRVWIIMGLAAGLALGTKSFGVVSAPLALVLWFGLSLWRAHKDQSPLWPVFARALGAGLITLAIGGWVYGYNFIEFGNPLYPYDFPIDLQAGQRPPEDFYSKSVLEGGASPLGALLRVIGLTPALLLALPPLGDMTKANSSGLGWMAPALLGVIFVLAAAAIVRRRAGHGEPLWTPGLKLWTAIFGVGLIVNYILASQWGVQIINKTQPDFSSLARYQLVWPALLATLAAILMPVRPALRMAVLGALALMFAGMTGWFVQSGQSRGWQTVKRVLPYFPDRTAQAARTFSGITPEMTPFLNKFQGANVLELGSRGHIYPLFYPTFIRQVYKSGFNQLDSNVLFNWDFDRTLYDHVVDRNFNFPTDCVASFRRDNPELTRENWRPIVMHLYNDQIVFSEDVSYVIVHADADRKFTFRYDSRYRLIETYENPAHGATFLYRRKNTAKSVAAPFVFCVSQAERQYELTH